MRRGKRGVDGRRDVVKMIRIVMMPRLRAWRSGRRPEEKPRITLRKDLRDPQILTQLLHLGRVALSVPRLSVLTWWSRVVCRAVPEAGAARVATGGVAAKRARVLLDWQASQRIMAFGEVVRGRRIGAI